MKVHFDLDAGPLDIELPDGLQHHHASHPIGFLLDPRERNQTKVYLDNVYSMAKLLPTDQHVLELFGGMGIYPKILWSMLKPRSWTSVDIDASLEPLYQGPEGSKFVAANAMTFPVPAVEPGILYIDVPTGTLQTIGRNMDGRRPMFERFMATRIPHIIATDMGYFWCHLKNHHPWYEATFGIVPTKANYHILYDQYMGDQFGYKVIDERHGSGCQIFHLVPHEE